MTDFNKTLFFDSSFIFADGPPTQGQCPALPAQEFCLGAAGMGFSASSLLQDSSFPFTPCPGNSNGKVLTRVGLAGALWLKPMSPHSCTTLSGHTHSITVGTPKIAFTTFNCTLLASVSLLFEIMLLPPTMGRYDLCVHICNMLRKGKVLYALSIEYIHFSEQTCCKNTELIPSTEDISGIAFIEVNIIFITLLQDYLLDKRILLLTFIYRKVFLFYAHILAYNCSNKV